MTYDIAVKLMTYLLPDKGYEEYDNIIIDLNSLLSVFSYLTVINEIRNRKLTNILLKDILLLMQNMIINIFQGKHIFIIYRDVSYDKYILDEIWQGFRDIDEKDIDSKLFQSLFAEILKVVNKLNDYSTVDIISTKDEEHSFLVDDLRTKFNINKALIISRDPMMLLNCINPAFDVWNGKHYYGEDKIQEYTKGTTLYTYIPPAMLRYVFLICGLRKTTYKGVKGVSMVKLSKDMKKDGFFNSDKVKKYLEEVDKYKPLFFISDYKKYVIERKLKLKEE